MLHERTSRKWSASQDVKQASKLTIRDITWNTFVGCQGSSSSMFKQRKTANGKDNCGMEQKEIHREQGEEEEKKTKTVEQGQQGCMNEVEYSRVKYYLGRAEENGVFLYGFLVSIANIRLRCYVCDYGYVCRWISLFEHDVDFCYVVNGTKEWEPFTAVLCVTL